MSDQVNPGRAEEHDAQESGLLLSVDPLEGNSPLRASAGDTTDTDTDARDTGDAAGDTDASDEDGGATDADLADAGADAGDEGTADAMDIIGDNADATDAARDADNRDV